MIQKFYTYADTFARYFVLTLFGVLLLIGALQVIARYVLGAPLDWSEELLKFTHIWLVFMAIPIAYNRGSHICVDMLSMHFPARFQGLFAFIVDLLWVAFAAIFIYYSTIIMEVSSRQTSAGLQIPMSWVYFGVVVGVFYLLLCALRNLGERLARGLGEVPQ